MVPSTDPAPDEVVSFCPLCGGRMELVVSRHHQQVCVCADCRVSINIPARAWEVARLKRETNPRSGPKADPFKG